MRCRVVKIAGPLLLPALALVAAPVSESTFPNETLHYSINWPSGLSLGEATLNASASQESGGSKNLHFQFDVDASVPGFAVSDRFRSAASEHFCSADFEKKTSQGQKRVDDSETFDPSTGNVTRGTGSGKSEILANVCSKDALAFIYFLRQELSQGRIPTKQTVFFGAPYEIKLESVGIETLKISGQAAQVDHLKASVDGPSSSISFDMFFLRDKARTLALVRVPFPLGTFSMELTK